MVRKYRGAQRIVLVRQQLDRLKGQAAALLKRPSSQMEWLHLGFAAEDLERDAAAWPKVLAEVKAFSAALITRRF